MTIVPIWKDTYVKFYSEEETPEYYITIQYFGDEEKVVYNGKTFGLKPSSSSTLYLSEIYLNAIVKDYLKTKVDNPLMGGIIFYYSQGIVRVYNSINDSIIGEEYVFVDDYSYEDFYYDRGVVCLSRPIKKNVANIPLPFTTYDYYEGDDNINCKWYAEDATGTKRNIASFYSTKYKATILFTPYDGLNKCYYYTEEDGITQVIEYMVDDCKSNYAYYYKNALGGYDVLCVSGKMIQIDNLERKTIEVYKDGKQNFENVITRTYSTFTGYLTEEQSLLMHHLLNSTEVYLYDIQEATYVPVVLTNTSTEYKTKQNQNKKMISYNITCEEATKKYRR